MPPPLPPAAAAARVRVSASRPRAPTARPRKQLRRRRIGRRVAPPLKSCCGMTIKITPNDKGNPAGKLADAELHFAEGDGPLAGLKLIGFSIWERRGGNGRNVTFPARSYAVNGERRSFSLLRPIVDTTAQDKLRELILEAYAEFEERAAIAS
ncbi:MAG TPA: hypothetical protein VFA27_05315 [Vicinamibacterales bacterium]|nr:hypothetical protein [Vicinamibacterales bacterium]